MDETAPKERQHIEIELLQAMYPDQVHFNSRHCELKYTGSSGSVLLLRIPETYPEKGLPLIISAINPSKLDIRAPTIVALEAVHLLEGEEVLDAIIQMFDETSSTHAKTNVIDNELPQQKEENDIDLEWKTVIIWLHHLLNTNKRKLALDPSLTAGSDSVIISGITKPGYPGILVYSGPMDLVDAHVSELRQQRWQAFQLRYEQKHPREGAWRFEHGNGIVEVESMSDIVQGIIDEQNREVFLKATGVK